MTLLAAAYLAAALLPTAPVDAAPAGFDLDQGADARAAFEELSHRPPSWSRDEDYLHPRYRRSERDCATVSFRREDPLTSERVLLESREYQERCYPRGPDGHMDCREEWVWTERRHVRVEVVGRGEMLPWEEDAFRVCLDGRWLDYRVVDASHEYDLTERGDTILARAGRKVPALPDPVGVVAESFRYDAASANFTLTLRDRWASYYAGNQTVVELELKRHRDNWFDETLLKKELSFSAAENHRVDFATWTGEMDPKPKAGKTYYVKWRFKRVGPVSKDKWVRHWESDRAVFGQASSTKLLAMAPSAAREGDRCWFRRIENDECVYRCGDGSWLRRPVRRPDPFDREDGMTIACPQLVIPF